MRKLFINMLNFMCFRRSRTLRGRGIPVEMYRSFLWILLFWGMGLPTQLSAQMVWTGPKLTFTKVDNSDFTKAENQDRITENVWITRGEERGIFNIKQENRYQRDFSPADTEWAFGTTSDIGNLTFADWRTAVNRLPINIVNRNMVLHLISEDIYIDIKFLEWEQMGGGFMYERSTSGEDQRSIKSINLIDIASQEVSKTLVDGDQIVRSDFPEGFGIVASTDPGTVGSVRFFLDGELVKNENAAPYSIAGDLNGIINPFALAPGEYMLTVVPYAESSGNGQAGDSLTLRVIIEEGLPTVSALNLVNLADHHVEELEEGDVISLSSFPTGFGIVAQANPVTTGSIRFFLNGALVKNENQAPFSIVGDQDGQLNPLSLAPGQYSLTATPYPLPNGGGMAGRSLTLNFAIQQGLPQVTALLLVNISDNQVVQRIQDGDVIVNAAFPEGYGLVAQTSPAEIGSVQFFLNEDFLKNENVAPYAIAGDNSGIIFPFPLESGNFTIQAIPYTGRNGSGEAGKDLSVRFEVIAALPSITSLNIIDVSSNQTITALEDESLINLFDFPQGFGIIAQTDTVGAGSVRFFLDDVFVNNENIAPYAFRGDVNGIINPTTLSPGSYRLKAIPYTGTSGSGLEGIAKMVLLEVIEGQSIVRLVALDTQSETVTLRNFGAISQDVSNYQLCLGPGQYNVLSNYANLSGDLLLRPDEELEIDLTSGTLNVQALPDANGGLSFFANTRFGSDNPEDLLDYVQWGAGNQNRVFQAIRAGRWTNTNDFVGGASPFTYSGGSNDIGAAFWNKPTSLQVYPNPSSGEISLEGEQGTTFQVINIFGKEIYTGALGNVTSTLRLPFGMYYLKTKKTLKRILIK